MLLGRWQGEAEGSMCVSNNRILRPRRGQPALRRWPRAANLAIPSRDEHTTFLFVYHKGTGADCVGILTHSMFLFLRCLGQKWCGTRLSDLICLLYCFPNRLAVATTAESFAYFEPLLHKEMLETFLFYELKILFDSILSIRSRTLQSTLFIHICWTGIIGYC